MSHKHARDALDTRVVVVTDADGDRGAAIARAMAAVDAAVVLAGSDVDALARLAAELTTAGARVAVLVDDVVTDAGRSALVEMVNELFPRRNT
jgi:NADP-dependent 3-hydroxy acid dehydrogenase YdfG